MASRMTWQIIQDDCIETMAAMPAGSVDAIVTDPPYGLGFMGRAWDDLPPGLLWAQECLRVLKPGGHLLAFGGTRTYHRLTCAIEDAGFEVRDCIAWMYGSGFPKSLDVGKAIDKRPGVARHAEFALHLRERMAAKGYTNTFDVAEAVIGRRTGAVANWQKYQWPEARWWPALRALLDLDDAWAPVIAEVERAKVGTRTTGIGTGNGATPIMGDSANRDLTAPATPEAERWDGWGTALKPAFEPIVVARKPLAGTVAGNVLAHGTGALNVDGCRIESAQPVQSAAANKVAYTPGTTSDDGYVLGTGREYSDAGRWPANVVLDEESAAVLDEQTGELTSGTAVDGLHRRSNQDANCYGHFAGERTEDDVTYGDTGGASRFFYVAKADSAERNAGLAITTLFTPPNAPTRNDHPTVKPIALMRWLVRLVTPPGGLVLDPFAGSGTTGCAAVLEAFNFVGIEREEASVGIARARIAHWSNGTTEDAA